MQDPAFAAAYKDLDEEFEAERLRIQAQLQRNAGGDTLLDLQRYPDLLRWLDDLEQLSQFIRWTTLLMPPAPPFCATAGYQVSGDAPYDAMTVTAQATC